MIFIEDSKYKYMEATLTQRRTSLEEKIPDIRKTLSMVEFLKERRVSDALFHKFFLLIRHSSSSKARVIPTKIKTDSRLTTQDLSEQPLNSTTHYMQRPNLRILTLFVCGLGYVLTILSCSILVRHVLKANVMLSYKIPAAISLLQSKLAIAQISLDNTVEDLEFLREQLTIMEVNTARVYNWDVKRRRERRVKVAASAE